MQQRDFQKGERWEVIAEGARLTGWRPVAPWTLEGLSIPLKVGDVLTCDGVSMTRGDGVPIVKWRDENGEHLAQDCEFSPSVGNMWVTAPADGFLRLLDH